MTTAIINITCITFLAIILYQDLRHRMISLILLPLVFAGFVIKGVLVDDIRVVAGNILLNWGLISMMLLILTGYISLKQGILTYIPDRFLGWGDIWLLVVLGGLFTPLGFVFFLAAGLILALVIALIFFRKNDIPLAGLLSLFVIVALIAEQTGLFFPFRDESLLAIIEKLYSIFKIGPVA